MFAKFASNVLGDLSDELHLEAYCCKSEEDAEILRNLAARVDWLKAKLLVESATQKALKEHE